MRRWLFLSACLAQLQIAALVGPASAGAEQQQWLGGALPNDWRMLGDDEGPKPPDAPPGQFDFPHYGPDQGPYGAAPGLAQRPPRPADPVADAAAVKAAKDKARAEALKKALEPKPEPAALRQRALDELFQHLGAAADPEEAKGFADAIQHIWLQSQSDTANLIMQRAMLASRMKNYPLSLSLLDRLVALEPDWAEAWNQRATVRFLNQDFDGAMADIDKVMKLEPRHFGALTGMGVILQQEGLDKRALEVFNKALEIYPAQPDLKDTVDKLTLDVNGRDI